MLVNCQYTIMSHLSSHQSCATARSNGRQGCHLNKAMIVVAMNTPRWTGNVDLYMRMWLLRGDMLSTTLKTCRVKCR
jgi:hypothetical protein